MLKYFISGYKCECNCNYYDLAPTSNEPGRMCVPKPQQCKSFVFYYKGTSFYHFGHFSEKMDILEKNLLFIR